VHFSNPFRQSPTAVIEKILFGKEKMIVIAGRVIILDFNHRKWWTRKFRKEKFSAGCCTQNTNPELWTLNFSRRIAGIEF